MQRKLGRSGLEVSAMGMGCWAIGGPFWEGKDALGWSKVDDSESVKAIHCALDFGINFFDTADVYGAGHSERVIGKALHSERKNVIIATKFGNVFDEETKQITGNNASPDYILNACDASLKRLNTDYIDLYQFHLNDFDPDKAGEVRDTLESLVQSGKIRFYGWSTDFRERAQVFEQGEHCTAVQHQLNVLDDNNAVLDFCTEKNLASINRGPLAMGLLTGKYNKNSQLGVDDVRGLKSPVWMKYFQKGRAADEWLEKVESLRQILTIDGRSLVQGALGWLWGRSSKTIPIPGFKNVKQVEENARAMEYGSLSEEQMLKIEEILER
ncbi:MAG: aldo/keto reductase [Calditrichae bacterium]|nr:aldo/keto reductase [Calditrichia bacterium]